MNERVKVVVIDGIEYIVVDNDDKPVEQEFRLYYDEAGKVLFYTMEKNNVGNYILVDKQTFIEARADWRVVDGKLTKLIPGILISKIKPMQEGISCSKDDVSIVVSEDFEKKQRWKLTEYELR